MKRFPFSIPLIANLDDLLVLIVKTAVESTGERNTFLVGDDTGLLAVFNSTPVQIASTYVSSQNQRQTPED